MSLGENVTHDNQVGVFGGVIILKSVGAVEVNHYSLRDGGGHTWRHVAVVVADKNCDVVDAQLEEALVAKLESSVHLVFMHRHHDWRAAAGGYNFRIYAVQLIKRVVVSPDDRPGHTLS